MVLSRRATLLGLAGAATLGRVRFALADAVTQKRFIVVLQRGRWMEWPPWCRMAMQI